MKQFIEMLPIALAIVAIFSGVLNIHRAKHIHGRIRILFGLVAATMLLFAQASWYSTLFFANETIDTSFADSLWSWFNTIVMALIISYSYKQGN